jgi:L-fuculose-phosphate aldolase
MTADQPQDPTQPVQVGGETQATGGGMQIGGETQAGDGAQVGGTQIDNGVQADSGGMQIDSDTGSNAAQRRILAAARRMYVKGLVEGTQGNVSARLGDGNICITPSSVPYEDMTIEDLVIMDMNGDVLEGTQSPSSEKLLHLDCYRRFPDVKAVIHSHPIYASMFALAGKPIPAWMDEAIIYLGGDIQVSEYGMSGTPEMAANAATALEGRSAALLANHGMVAVGKSPDHAIEVTILVEKIARIVLGATQLGSMQPLPEKTTTSLVDVYLLMRSMW